MCEICRVFIVCQSAYAISIYNVLLFSLRFIASNSSYDENTASGGIIQFVFVKKLQKIQKEYEDQFVSDHWTPITPGKRPASSVTAFVTPIFVRSLILSTPMIGPRKGSSTGIPDHLRHRQNEAPRYSAQREASD